MRSLSNAICTSGEPVSVSCVLKSSITSFFLSAFCATVKTSSCFDLDHYRFRKESEYISENPQFNLVNRTKNPQSLKCDSPLMPIVSNLGRFRNHCHQVIIGVQNLIRTCGPTWAGPRVKKLDRVQCGTLAYSLGIQGRDSQLRITI